MHADEAEPTDDSFAALLAAHEQALLADQAAPNAEQTPPELQARLSRALDCVRALRQMWPEQAVNAAPDAQQATAAASAGNYTRTRVHATGGIGRVWLAHDTRLHRAIALKELRAERMNDRDHQARFLREALITSQLQHPGIVPVYELVQDADGQPPYYTMRFVQGRTLTDAARAYHQRRAARQATVFDLRVLLDAFISVCNTLAYAHAQGVIHRDLKGDNVVLGDFGEVIVLDWGFARVLSSAPERQVAVPELPAGSASVGESLAGTILGTPAYMAPEQARGDSARLDERTDVYGLGAILFELVTGGAPNAGQDSRDILERLRSDQPKPRVFDPGVPPALAAICRKALAHRPPDRYGSATELGREIQRFLADEPVQAYREPLMARLRRKARRHRTAVSTLAALIFSSVTALIVGMMLLGQERTRFAEMRAQTADDHAALSAHAAAELEHELYCQRLALAERELAASVPSRAVELLDACPQSLRGWEWYCLQRRCYRGTVTLRGHSAAVASLVFHPDGRRLFSAGHDHIINIWDLSTGQVLQTLRGHKDVVFHLALSPDGQLLASGSWDQSVNVWDAHTGQLRRVLTDHSGPVKRVAFGTDGRTLAVLTGKRITLWDVQTGQVRRTWEQHAQLYGLAMHPDGKHLAATTSDRSVVCWDLGSGAQTLLLRGHTSIPHYLAFSPNGQQLASGDGDPVRDDRGIIRIWDPATGEERFTLRNHAGPITGLAFHPQQRRLASASQDQTIKIWDTSTGQNVLTLRGPADSVRAVAFSPDGRLLGSANADHTISLWDGTPWDGAKEPEELYRLTTPGQRMFALAFSPDGQRLASLSEGVRLKLWAVATGTELPFSTAFPPRNEALALAYSPDSRYLATALGTGTILILDASSGKTLATLRGHQGGPIKSVCFSPDGRQLASASWDRTVKLWDLDTKQLIHSLDGHTEAVTSVAFQPTADVLVSGGYDQTIKVWNRRTGILLRTLPVHAGRIQCATFSADGRFLAVASKALVQIWETRTWTQVGELRGHSDSVYRVAFSPSGRLLATASDDWTVKIWLAATGQELRTLRGHTGYVRSVAFHPHGHRLASASYDGSLRLWDISQFEKE